MITEFKTLQNLKDFCNQLTEAQLKLPVVVVETDRNYDLEICGEIYDCDQINPSGYGLEDITDYSEGDGQYDPENDITEECIIAKTGEIRFIIDIKFEQQQGEKK